MMRQIEPESIIATRNNDIENEHIHHEWKNVEHVMYRSNSNRSKTKVISRSPIRSHIVHKRSIIDSIIPTKDEVIFDILLPTIRRSIREALLG